MRQINKIIIHCAATPPIMDIGVSEIRDWHVNGNGWSDVGYHYVIRRSGMVEEGRPVDKSGAHARGHNADSIGICLVGGVDADQNPIANFTRPQWAALSTLVDGLVEAYWPVEVIGHHDVDPHKECPCFDVKAWMEEVA